MVVSRGQSGRDPSWPPRSRDLSVCDYFVRGVLKTKVHRNNPHSLQELQQNISDDIEAIPVVQLRSAVSSLVTRAHKCQEMNGGHFQHLLQSDDNARPRWIAQVMDLLKREGIR
ncbi:uncharacterized protein LOC126471573 [Schistocerca serialis cubense]|uniref:uncharacterized protein LOC126471573 n=1 Tax=Schistocerca serialis cubense TaxID=2023355 RepID=UPI00214DF548|nr:uncharacterized protein LOC126471573 [Schistocerca serialis cubense]